MKPLKARLQAGFFVCCEHAAGSGTLQGRTLYERGTDMVGLAELWLPILISGVVVFIASSVMWMVLPHHKADIKVLPDEKKFTEALGSHDIPPGLYMWPNCNTPKEMSSEDYKNRFKNGPWGTITVQGQAPNFPMNLMKCFVMYMVITAMVAYLAGIGLAPGAEYMEVFRVIGTAAILGHCMGGLVNDTFLGKPTRFIITGLFDGVVYALITAGIFAAMWPEGITAAIPTIN